MLLPWILSVNDILNGSAENHEPKKKNSVQSSLKSYPYRDIKLCSHKKTRP